MILCKKQNCHAAKKRHSSSVFLYLSQEILRICSTATVQVFGKIPLFQDSVNPAQSLYSSLLAFVRTLFFHLFIFRKCSYSADSGSVSTTCVRKRSRDRVSSAEISPSPLQSIRTLCASVTEMVSLTALLRVTVSKRFTFPSKFASPYRMVSVLPLTLVRVSNAFSLIVVRESGREISSTFGYTLL